MQYPILDMLQAYFKNQTLELDPSLEEEMIKIAKEQALTPFLYHVYAKKEFKSFYITAAITQEAFLKLQEYITNLFNQNQIRHIYFKGSVLNEIYPDPTLRTRGDIDVYVDEQDFLKAKKLFLDNDFKILHVDSRHHIEFRKNNLMVELHFALFDSFRNNKYFDHPFELAYQKDQYLYAFTNENHFVYCLHHFKIHLRLGAGLRYLLDFYYMLKKYPMDMQKLHELIEQENFQKLYQNIINAIYVLSGEKLDDVIEEDVTFFLDYLAKSGIHGFGEENEREKRGFGIKTNKLKAILSGTFLTDKNYRISKYPHLGRHWFTYPLCLIHRIIYLIFTQTGKLFSLLFAKKNKVSKEEKELFEKLGVD